MKTSVLVSKECFANKAEALSKTGGFKKGWAATKISLTVQEIAEKWLAGHSIVPACMKAGKAVVDDNWISQQIFALDFDNENGDKERVSDNCYMLPFEAKAMAECSGLLPAFIYSSFSSSSDHCKFRMVFVLDQLVTTEEMHKEVTAKLYSSFKKGGFIVTDTKCSDMSRIYYGGTELLYHNYEAITPLSRIKSLGITSLHNISRLRSKRNGSGERINDFIPISQMHSEYICGDTTPAMTAILQGDPLKLKEYIHNGTDSTLTTIKNTCTVCMNMNPYKIIKRLPLDLILGVPLDSPFRCILHGHKDAHPSAMVQKLADGTYAYFCHSCYGSGNGQTFIDLIMEAIKCSVSETISFCETAFGVLLQTKHQRLSRNRCDNILEFINSPQFSSGKWQPLYVYMKRKKLLSHYRYYLERAIFYSSPESIVEEGVPSFYESVRETAIQMASIDYCSGKDKDSVSKKRNELVHLGLFDKVTSADNPSLAKAQEYQKMRGNNYHKEFLVINPLSEETLTYALQQIIEAKKSGERAKYRTRASLTASRHRAANLIFAQDAGKDISRYKRNFINEMMHTVAELTIKGWTTEEEIVRVIMDTTKYTGVSRLVGQFRPLLTNGKHYTLETVCKELRNRLHLPDDIPTRKKIIIPVRTDFRDIIDQIFG